MQLEEHQFLQKTELCFPAPLQVSTRRRLRCQSESHSDLESQGKSHLHCLCEILLHKFCIWNTEISDVHQIPCQLLLNVTSCTLGIGSLSKSEPHEQKQDNCISIPMHLWDSLNRRLLKSYMISLENIILQLHFPLSN
jgi:hypothetical protein